MKKQIVFEEEEFKEKFKEFVDNFIEMSKKGYGCKLLSNETNEVIEDRDTITGIFYLPWSDTFQVRNVI